MEEYAKGYEAAGLVRSTNDGEEFCETMYLVEHGEIGGEWARGWNEYLQNWIDDSPSDYYQTVNRWGYEL